MSFVTIQALYSDELASSIGNKARSLSELYHLGFNVPNGFVIDPSVLIQIINETTIQADISRLEKLIDIREGQDEQLDQVTGEIQQALVSTSFNGALKQRLETALGEHQETRFAVRSSGHFEDLDDASFAGLYETVLNVKGVVAVEEAIKKCWASLYSPRVIQYCLRNAISIQDLGMSVIVQQMVESEKSGVLFTVNPITGRDTHMLIESCFGLGDALMSGEVTPDQVIYDWYQQALVTENIQSKRFALMPIQKKPFIQRVELTPDRSDQPVLSEHDIVDVVQQAVKIQAHYGYPVDIEWAYAGGVLYILQVRGITKIQYEGIAGEWSTADFKDGGVSSTVCSPFMWSLYDFVWESELPRHLDRIKLKRDRSVTRWGAMFYGRPYWNVGAIKTHLKQLPGFCEQEFDEELGVAAEYGDVRQSTPLNFKSLWSGARSYFALQTILFQAQKEWAHFRERQLKRLHEIENLDPSMMNQEQLFTFYEVLIEQEYFQSESAYFKHIFTTSNLVSLFKEQYNDDLIKLYDREEIGFLELVSGLDDVSHLNLNNDIWDLSRAILLNEADTQYWREQSPYAVWLALKEGEKQFCIPQLALLIDRYGYHSTRELDITVARYSENPRFIIESVMSNLKLDSSADPRALSQKQVEQFNKYRERFLHAIPWYKRRLADASLSRLRQFLWWRETYRDLSVRFYFHVRRFTLALVPFFKQWGVLKHENEIFLLSKDQILDIIRGELDYSAAREVVVRNQYYYEGFRYFQNRDEIGGKYTSAQTAMTDVSEQQWLDKKSSGVAHKHSVSSLKGLPCSPGVVVGRIKVISDIFDAHRIEHGDILVTRFTDPAWIPTFGLLKAVATETGGVLSHAAVISREFGIPAVLAIPNLTRICKEGQWVKIDGGKGVVELLDESEAESEAGAEEGGAHDHE